MNEPKKLSHNQILGVILIVAFINLGIGATFYHFVEGFVWLDAFYFATLLQQLVKATFHLKLIWANYLPSLTPLMGIGILGAIINTVSQRRMEKMMERRDRRLGNE